MLTYTFSRREKALILGLAIVLVVIAWYMLVFKSTTEQIEQIQTEISIVDEESAVASAKVSQMAYMNNIIEKRKAQGVKPTPVPEYDNLQALMTFLDSVMSRTDTYQLSFGALDVQSSKYILRPVSISFTCDSYDTAESVVKALASGPYPCIIDSVSTSDGTYRNTYRDTAYTVCSGAIKASFFEKNDGTFKVAE